jgi:hypothetical protein
MLDDLTMLATLPVDEAAVRKAREDEALDSAFDKAATAETMTRPTVTDDDPDIATAESTAPGGQGPLEQEDGDPVA